MSFPSRIKHRGKNEILAAICHSHPAIFYNFVLANFMENKIHEHSKDIFMEWKKKEKKQITRSSVLWHRIFSERRSKAALTHHFF